MAKGTPAQSKKYAMQISRLTIDKLGVKLYDKVSAVLSELVANAYDADAEWARVILPFDMFLANKVGGHVTDKGLQIVIQDNGHGMTADEVNRFYLNVGFNRRTTRGEVTPRYKRRVMGRKGIGKLAPFGICREIELVTAGGQKTSSGYCVSNLVLRYDDILEETSQPYNPKPGPKDETFAPETGTKIILRDFERKRVPDGETLHRQLAARFGLKRKDWSIQVTDSATGHEFTVGDLEIKKMPGTEIVVDARPVDMDGTHLPVSGWIAYSEVPYKDEAMAGVRIFARGKLVAQTRDFEIGSGFTGEYKMRSYLVGEVHADWLDEGDDDVIRSDRQDILWSSEKGEALRAWGEALIRELAKSADTSIRSQTWDDFLRASPLEERLESLKDADVRESIRRAAKLFVKRTDREAVRDPDYAARVTDLAFAIGPHKALLDTLHDIAEEATTTVEMVIDLFSRASIAETYSLGQVAQERVQAVKKLDELIRSHETEESQLQELIERSPWLLHPEWTRLTENESLATLRHAFEAWYERELGRKIVTSTIDNPTKRPDFVMVRDMGWLEIVEIKRPDYAITDDELSRAYGYLEALRRFLEANQELGAAVRGPKLTIICDKLGLKSPLSQGTLKAPDVVRIPWTQVLANTSHVHEDFLKRVHENEILAARSDALDEPDEA